MSSPYIRRQVDRSGITQRLMRSIPIVVLHPDGKLVLNTIRSGINRRPELLQDDQADAGRLAKL